MNTPQPSFKEAMIFIVVFAVLIFGGKAIHAHFVYGDWTCGFARCVKVKP